ncbi:hypothetical protein AVEN_63552-1 [Araneus ventricosus]|uniref:Uncharacterized protein n=1 Tax=Araneus ventricosus TaxID=182803 RepID=A0A4Y2SIE5_ARAVE|nr:hypothetical protein AVEN_63552-1 [Araneus ventricosus]
MFGMDLIKSNIGTKLDYPEKYHLRASKEVVGPIGGAYFAYSNPAWRRWRGGQPQNQIWHKLKCTLKIYHLKGPTRDSPGNHKAVVYFAYLLIPPAPGEAR